MSPSSSWSFPPFRLDPVTCSLWRDDALVPLPPKPLAVLAVLVAQAGRVVTKEALLDAVWPDTAVTEGVLKGCISQIRRALGEVGTTAQYIATVHGRGYRFIAPVTRVLAPAEMLAPAGPSTPPGALPPMPFHAGTPLLMVGREAELVQVHQWWAQARQGTRQVVFVTGEAGIGKTTLVDAFVTQVAPTEPIWIGRGQCLEQHGAGEPYLPLLEAFGRLGRGPDGSQMVAVLQQQAPSWLLHLPALMPEDAYEALQRRGGGVTHERMLRELAEALEALTTTRPVVLVLEDLHWSDGATVDWLAYVARRRETARLLVLGTYRLTEALVQGHPVHKMAQELQRHGQGRELVLGYFPEAAVAAYLAQRFGTPQLPAGLVHALHQRTTGNPLFLTTVVDMLVRQGQLQEGGTSGEGGGDLEVSMMDVPDSLRQLMEQQLAQLAPEVQAVLEAASVAGKEFAVAAVAAAVAQAVDAVEDHCGALARQGQFLRACGTDIWPDGTVAERFGFLHDLYRETLYARVPVGRRVRWHRQIGTRLEQGYGTKAREVAAELAMHFLRGRVPQRAVPYLHAAGETALRRSAPQEAITYLTQGIGLLQQWPDTRERAQQELHIQLVLGRALMVTKGWGHADVGHTYARARSLCEELGDPERLFPVLAGLWEYANGSAQHTLARELGERLLALAQEHNDPALLLPAHQALWTTAFNTGGFATAYQHLEHGLALCTSHPHQAQTEVYGGYAPGPSVRSYASLTLWYLGYPDQAMQWYEAAAALAREWAHPFTLGHTLVFAARLHRWYRDAQATFEYAQAALTLGTEQGSQYLVAFSTALLGWALATQGQGPEGLTQLRRGLAAWEAIGTPHHRPWFLACLAEGCGRLGRVEEGLAALAEALDIVEATGERKDASTLYRLQGELLWQAGNRSEEMAACFHQALTMAHHQQAKSLELRAALSLSRLWLQQGKRTAAYDLLAPLYGWFSEGFETADLQEAKAVLAECA